MKAYKATLLIVDHDGIGEDEITTTLEVQRYPNRCISPDVIAVESADIGEWTDEHPLNHRSKRKAEVERLFPVVVTKGGMDEG